MYSLEQQEDDAHNEFQKLTTEMVSRGIDPRVIINAAINNALSIMKGFLSTESVLIILADIQKSVERQLHNDNVVKH